MDRDTRSAPGPVPARSVLGAPALIRLLVVAGFAVLAWALTSSLAGPSTGIGLAHADTSASGTDPDTGLAGADQPAPSQLGVGTVLGTATHTTTGLLSGVGRVVGTSPDAPAVVSPAGTGDAGTDTDTDAGTGTSGADPGRAVPGLSAADSADTVSGAGPATADADSVIGTTPEAGAARPVTGSAGQAGSAGSLTGVGTQVEPTAEPVIGPTVTNGSPSTDLARHDRPGHAAGDVSGHAAGGVLDSLVGAVGQATGTVDRTITPALRPVLTATAPLIEPIASGAGRVVRPLSVPLVPELVAPITPILDAATGPLSGLTPTPDPSRTPTEATVIRPPAPTSSVPVTRDTVEPAVSYPALTGAGWVATASANGTAEHHSGTGHRPGGQLPRSDERAPLSPAPAPTGGGGAGPSGSASGTVSEAISQPDRLGDDVSVAGYGDEGPALSQHVSDPSTSPD